jgi:hypothetical protein
MATFAKPETVTGNLATQKISKMKSIMSSDVLVNIEKGYLKLPSLPAVVNEDSLGDPIDLNSMKKINLIPEKKNYFKLTSEIVQWFDCKRNYEIYQVFEDELLIGAYLKKLTIISSAS